MFTTNDPFIFTLFQAEDDEIDEEALLGFDNDGADFLWFVVSYYCNVTQCAHTFTTVSHYDLNFLLFFLFSHDLINPFPFHRFVRNFCFLQPVVTCSARGGMDVLQLSLVEKLLIIIES